MSATRQVRELPAAGIAVHETLKSAHALAWRFCWPGGLWLLAEADGELCDCIRIAGDGTEMAGFRGEIARSEPDPSAVEVFCRAEAAEKKLIEGGERPAPIGCNGKDVEVAAGRERLRLDPACAVVRESGQLRRRR